VIATAANVDTSPPRTMKNQTSQLMTTPGFRAGAITPAILRYIS
jgi:hypothetical protein